MKLLLGGDVDCKADGVVNHPFAVTHAPFATIDLELGGKLKTVGSGSDLGREADLLGSTMQREIAADEVTLV